MEIGELPAYGAVVVAVAAGLVSFLSPCVAPLVPGYVAFVAGDHADSRRTVQRALAFVAGFSIVFTLLGATAASVSRQLLSNRAELELFAGLLLAMIGVLMLWGRSPFPQTANRLVQRVSAPAGILGAVLVGAAFSIAWSPCIGPVLAGILTIAGGSADPAWGAVLLLAYSAGLGVPFLLVGLGIARARTWSRRLRANTRLIQAGAGVAMIAMGALVAAGVLGRLTGYLARYVPMWG